MNWTTSIPYFSENELACKGSGIINLDIRFAIELPKLRKEWDKPLSTSSVCRSPSHNASVNGNYRSFHMTTNPVWPTYGTMAADIIWRNWSSHIQIEFGKLAYELGWSIGLHNSFCHIDRRIDLGIPKLPQTIFLYGDWDNKFTHREIR